MEGQKARDDNSTVKRIGALEKRCSATEERCSAAEERVLSTEAMAQKYASLEEIIAKQSNQIANQSNQINSLNDKYEKGCTAAEEKRLTLEVIIAKQSNQLKILNDMYKQMEGRLQNPAHGIIGIEYKKKKRSSSPSEIYQASVTGVKNKKNRSASSSFKTLSWKDQLVQPIPMKKRKRTMLCNNKGLSDNDSTDADDDLYHSSFASDGFDSSIIGRIIRVNEENQLCLVAGECKTNQGKEHKIWYLNERRSLIVKLTRDNCSILEDHELPWMPRGLLGKQLSLVWNGVYEGAAPISFGSFVVQDLGGGIYTMLYSVNDTRVANKYGGDDGVPTRKKESSDDPVWERIDINIQKTIDWSRKMIARRAPSRAVRNKSIQIGDIINLKWPDDGKYYQALVMGITGSRRWREGDSIRMLRRR